MSALSRRGLLQGAAAGAVAATAVALPEIASATPGVDPAVVLKAERDRRWKEYAAVEDEADRILYAMPEDLRRHPVAQLPRHRMPGGGWRAPEPLSFAAEEQIAEFVRATSAGNEAADRRHEARLTALWRRDKDRIEAGRAALGWTALNERSEALLEAAAETERALYQTPATSMAGILAQLEVLHERLGLEEAGDLVELIIGRLREMAGADLKTDASTSARSGNGWRAIA